MIAIEFFPPPRGWRCQRVYSVAVCDDVVYIDG
jgi:hypothetical protein